MEIAQPPEGKLLEAARTRRGSSIRGAAAAAAISEGRWRQIEKGYQSAGGTRVPAIAPATTLMQMAKVLGITAAELEAAGRPDAAALIDLDEVPVDIDEAVAVVQEWAADPVNRQLPLQVFAFISDAALMDEVARRISGDPMGTLSDDPFAMWDSGMRQRIADDIDKRIERQENDDVPPKTQAAGSAATTKRQAARRAKHFRGTPSEDQALAEQSPGDTDQGRH